MRRGLPYPRLWACLLLLLFGAARVPVERLLQREYREHKFREGLMLDQSMRERLGQLGFAASLGGFRSFLATIFELQAVTAWQEVDYDEVESSYNLVTQLQPRESSYWDSAAWHLGKNAVSYYLHFDLDRPLAERQRDAAAKSERAGRFYADGIRYNPEAYRLLAGYARYLIDTKGDYAAGADLFLRAYEATDGRFRQALRFAGYALAEVPGRQREAYNLLLGVYRQGERQPRVVMTLKTLEDALDIPVDERIPDPIPEVFLKRGERGEELGE